MSQICTLAGMGCGECHIKPAYRSLNALSQVSVLCEGKVPMTAYSLLANLLRPANQTEVDIRVRAPVLLPRTAADDLPPYRDQPWVIDKSGYRKADPSMTLVPVSRL